MKNKYKENPTSDLVVDLKNDANFPRESFEICVLYDNEVDIVISNFDKRKIIKITKRNNGS
jgi:hypothetical protein